MKSIRLGVVYGAPPIFCADIDQMGYVEPDCLLLTPPLVADLKAWNQDFQATFCEDYPPDSGFQSEDERLEHNKRGVQLWLELQQELGANMFVEFIPLRA